MVWLASGPCFSHAIAQYADPNAAIRVRRNEWPHLFFLRLVELHELGIFAAYLNCHRHIGTVAIAPEPAVLSVKRGGDLALGTGGASAFFIGHGLAAAMAVQVEIHPAALDEHPVFSHLACVHLHLPVRRVAWCQRKSSLITPDHGFLRMRGTDKKPEDIVQQA